MPSTHIATGDYAGEADATPDPRENPLAHRRLWQAVILQLVEDATADHHQKAWAEDERDDCHEAIRYLLNPISEDFRMTCSFAGWNSQRLGDDIRVKLMDLMAVYRDNAERLLFRSMKDNVPASHRKAAKDAAKRYIETATLIERCSK